MNAERITPYTKTRRALARTAKRQRARHREATERRLATLEILEAVCRTSI